MLPEASRAVTVIRWGLPSETTEVVRTPMSALYVKFWAAPSHVTEMLDWGSTPSTASEMAAVRVSPPGVRVI